ncbi:thiamine diphosphokinase [Sporanaerobacter acetigenes]|uniref:Thiamine diphosphokinase n=1 Tax=Sporanaerobacter acetigenes DSM 13106 TaxID=1123281 RepID=A0A1M5XX74_9FIRM|nr:thiamine diphosphokinase [Sporanaerobacter acetigenes]SHI04431.1 thiamine pyrophosphokinase [Sporanaerobacter acetigenes DSM 13106]
MKGLIVSNGEISNLNLLKSIAKSVDMIVCADGGANHIAKIGFIPDLVVGDLDSINDDTLNIINTENVPILKYSTHKDYTDTELAIEYLIDKGMDEIIFMGVTGSRIDHTLANLYLLNKLLKRDIRGIIVDDKNTIYITNSVLELKRKEGTFVSVIPISSNGAKVTLKGFLYETNEVLFEFSSTLGVSNQIVKEKGIIEVLNGTCLVIVSKD